MISLMILFPTFDKNQVENDQNNAEFHQWWQAACDTAHLSHMSIFIKTRPWQSVPNSGFHLVGPGLILVNLV